MKQPQYLGHAITTEARAVGDRWRGYYRVDEGGFSAVTQLDKTEAFAHLTAKYHAELAINRTETARAAARQTQARSPSSTASAPAPRRSPGSRAR
jgi:hypothetical protein